MEPTIRQRKALPKQTAARYRSSVKKQKTRILDECVAATENHRKYGSWLPRNWGKKRQVRIDGELVELVVGRPRQKKKREARESKYDKQVFGALKKVWYLFDCLCGKRLAPVLRSMLPVLYKFGEIDLMGHEGGEPRGDFAFTLNVTDVNTGWCEPRAIKKKAQKWAFEALLQTRKQIPFEIHGID